MTIPSAVHFDVVQVAAWIIVIAAGRWLWDVVAAVALRFVREFFPEDPADRRPNAWRAMFAAAAWRAGLFLALLAIWPVSKWLFALLKRVAQEKHLL